MLGTFPESPDYTSFELNDAASLAAHLERYPALRKMRHVVSSDAHNLWSMREADAAVELDDDLCSSQRVREALIAYLRGE